VEVEELVQQELTLVQQALLNQDLVVVEQKIVLLEVL
jgi:hypothetical protein|tara:strand:+ start:257 stop:367 length:111 start_codon:yes stop_codon:yes gene_type:complete